MADSAEMMENKLLKRFTGAACYKSTFQKECMTKYKTFLKFMVICGLFIVSFARKKLE